MVVTPKSIKKIEAAVRTYVATHTEVSTIDEVELEVQLRWEKICDHELFYSDINRFIGDLVHERNLTSRL